MQELIKALRCTSDDHFHCCHHDCRYYTRCSDEEIKQFCEENGRKEEDFVPGFFCYCDTNRIGQEAADALEKLTKV